MIYEELEDEGLDKVPDLELAKKKYKLSLPEYKENEELKTELLNEIINNNMAPWYQQVCKDLNWELDSKLLAEMTEKNEVLLAELEEDSIEAEGSLNEADLREAYVKKAEYFSKIGDFENAVKVLEQAHEKTVSMMQKLKILFHSIRIGFFSMDHKEIAKNIEKAEALIGEGGDWDMRNRFKVYKGLYMMSVKKFKEACELFLDTTSTFTSYEILDYNSFMRYTVLSSVVALNRNELKTKVIKASDILSVLHSNSDVNNFMFSLYNCQYAEFFINLASVECQLKQDFFLNPHYRFYVREMKIKAYSQLLESYSSLSLQYMADSFGVSVEYMDEELVRFITAGRLTCKIDRIGGIVETNRPELKNAQLQAILRNGDVLLNRVQKLSRVINI